MRSSLITLARHRFYNKSSNGALLLGAQCLRILGLRYLMVQFDTNRLCNLKCPMCHFSDPDHKNISAMKMDLFMKIAADIFPRTRWLYLSDRAEPMMTKKLGDYLEVVSRYRIPHVGMMTNGQLLTERRVNELIDFNVSELGISMDAATPDTYEKIRVKGKFDVLMENLERFVAIKRERKAKTPRLRFNYVVMNENLAELVPFLDCIARFSPDRVQVRHLGINRNMEWTFESQSVKAQQREFNREIKRFSDRAKQLGISVDVPDPFPLKPVKTRPPRRSVPGCICPWVKVVVHADGSYRPCLNHEAGSMPSFVTNTYDEIVNSDQIRQIRRTLIWGKYRSCVPMGESRRTDSVVNSEELLLPKD